MSQIVVVLTFSTLMPCGDTIKARNASGEAVTARSITYQLAESIDTLKGQ